MVEWLYLVEDGGRALNDEWNVSTILEGELVCLLDSEIPNLMLRGKLLSKG
jgi:hypothetical protein